MGQMRPSLCLVLLAVAAAPAVACTDAEYKVFREYDAALERASRDTPDEVIRNQFARRVGMRPAELKDLYFRCLMRWQRQEPGEVQSTAKKAAARTDAGGESPLTLGHSCSTLGYRYGHTGTRSMMGLPSNPGWTFEMPGRCRNNPETETGIKAGTRAAAGSGSVR